MFQKIIYSEIQKYTGLPLSAYR